MDKFLILRVVHFVYLALLLVFIYFYFSTYQPLKLHNICAETSAKTVLKASSSGDAYDLYQGLYKDCISQKSVNLLALFPSIFDKLHQNTI